MSAPRRWLALSVRDGSGFPHVAELLPEAIRRLGGGGAEEDDRGGLVTYFPEPEDPELLLEEVRREIEAYTGTSSLDLSWRWQEHEAWADTWRRGFEPRRITDRLVVSPSWRDPELQPGEVLVTLDPGVAFGTAEHPTTRGCLRFVDRVVEPDGRWADIGAGSGILGIAAVRIGAEFVTAIEPDGLSCAAIEENARRNGVEAQIRILPGLATPDLLSSLRPFDGIVANIESGVILPLLPSFRAALDAGGLLVVSGILHYEAQAVVEEAASSDLELLEEDREEEWWTGLFRAGV